MQFLKKGKRRKIKAKRWTTQKIRRAYLNAIHDVWSLCIRYRDERCVWCGSTNMLQAHHIVAKSMLGGKLPGLWDYDNGMSLCYRCHIHKLKADPDAYIEVRDNFLISKGLSYQILRDRFDLRTKFHISEIKGIYNWVLCVDLLKLDSQFQENIDKITKRYLSKIEG